MIRIPAVGIGGILDAAVAPLQPRRAIAYPAAMPRLRFQPQGIELDVPRGTRLVDAVRSAGLPIASACGDELVCARCGVRVLSGQVGRESRLEREAKVRNRIAPELRLACALRVNFDLEISADYWGEP